MRTVPYGAFYLAKGNQVLVEDMKHMTVNGSGNDTSPGGHDYPSQLTFNWENGTDTVSLTLSEPKLLVVRDPAMVTNATIVGTPEYMRLSGNGTLNVNIDGNNETATTPAVWEVQYGH